MKNNLQRRVLLCLLIISLAFSYSKLFAQTEHDAIMLNKAQWCNGFSYMNSKWTDYWEGSYKRNNDNIGSVSTQSVMYMTNYGISDKLNVLAGLPYVWTSASKGTLHGMKGLQDASLFLKWKPITIRSAKEKFSLFAVAGVSTPVSNYVIDFLPLSIGLGSTNVSGRLLADYQKGIFFTTISGAYVRRSNVKLDRDAYYTTELHNTTEVKMPDMALYNFSVGIRKKYLVAEALLNNMTTLGGFDIRKNDMPFPSNRMNSTSVGVHAKYTLPRFTHIELTGEADYVLSGRNVGRATSYGAGLYYIFSLHPNKSSK
ncbi:hypothetical protein [Segetibacter koreensis]|uniref:hypothetical protein n=1 Tax=Segetibacter koreensis TaxID=398037 RepID=UPI00035DE3D4|nr:hypothetical protein [Segetibacter koreensis]